MKGADKAYAGAYLIAGDEGVLDVLVEKMQREKVVAAGSPDLFRRSYRAFGVEDAEDIIARARMRAVKGERRVFALFVPNMTREAQNALLKTIEEPAAEALFFLITPSPETLLPTVRSRAQAMHLTAASTAGAVDADTFLKSPVATRLGMLKPLYEHDEDEGRDIGSVISFLQSCERAFAKAKPGEARDAGLRALYRARKYAGDKGSLLKALLEQFALLAPKV